MLFLRKQRHDPDSATDVWVDPFMAAIRDPSIQAMGIQSLESLESGLGGTRWDITAMYVLLGSNDRAFDSAVESTLRHNHIWMPHMRVFRQDSRFETLMEKMGLISYWQDYGWPDSCQTRTWTANDRIRLPASRRK